MVRYEWDVETMDSHGDIEDHHHDDTVRPLLQRYRTELKTAACELVLVRDVWDMTAYPDLIEREWAYVRGEKLPEFFHGGPGVDHKVPKRFHTELAGGFENVE